MLHVFVEAVEVLVAERLQAEISCDPTGYHAECSKREEWAVVDARVTAGLGDDGTQHQLS